LDFWWFFFGKRKKETEMQLLLHALLCACVLANAELSADVLAALAHCRQFAMTHLRNREQSVASYMHVCFEMAFAHSPLVFGLGLDSRMYLALNSRVVFVENNIEWIHLANLPCAACVVHMNYSTVMQDGVVLRDDEIPPLDAQELRGRAFDFILVDAPHGRKAGEPGRYQPIKFASQQRAAGHLAHVCVHD